MVIHLINLNKIMGIDLFTLIRAQLASLLVLLASIWTKFFAFLDDDIIIQRVASMGVVLSTISATFVFLLILRKTFIKYQQDRRSKKKNESLRL